MVADTLQVRSAVDEAMNHRKFDIAIIACAQGLSIDKQNKKLMAEFYARRAKAYIALARQQQQLKSSHSSTNNSSVSVPRKEDAEEGSRTSWRKALQDAHNSLYFDGGPAGIPALLLKCDALQALGQYKEAVDEVGRYSR